jgi:heme A synthase
MLILVALAAAWGGWRAGRAALHSLRSLPRRNEDMVFY